jgi:hypothetical protein
MSTEAGMTTKHREPATAMPRAPARPFDRPQATAAGSAVSASLSVRTAATAVAAVQRGDSRALPTARGSLLRLQRSHGNRFVHRLVAEARGSAPRSELVEPPAAVAAAAEASNSSGPAGGAGAQPHGGTRLPDRLKAGVEALSGLAMDGVRVHYNSASPARVSAHAHAQGNDIHVGPGQERHLPHEAWHVVQQMQGRVRATQRSQGFAINDDMALEREADVMGARAMRPAAAAPVAIEAASPAAESDEAGRSERTDRPIPRPHSMAGSPRTVVQRKVGFEIEMPNILVARGTLVDRTKDKSGKLEVPEEEEHLIGGSGQFFQSSFSSKHSDLEDRFEVRETGVPVKGEKMTGQTGWKLTPDGGEGNWYAEFITDPIDETKQARQIAVVMDAVADYAAGIGLLPDHEFRTLDRKYLIQRRPGAIRGAFHITGGIKLDQILALLQRLSDAARFLTDTGAHLNEDEADILDTATGASAQIGGGSAAYKGLVALVGSYIAGQRRAGETPASAKHFLPVMSRTNLGDIRTKVAHMPAFGQFEADVLAAANLAAGDATLRLFPHGLEGGLDQARTIDANPDITIRAWLAGIYRGRDLSWSETRTSAGKPFKFEGVGPDIPRTFLHCLPWFSTRAEGAILELRNLDGIVPVARWTNVSVAFAEVFRNLNAQ